jgi:hypothetical protein
MCSQVITHLPGLQPSRLHFGTKKEQLELLARILSVQGEETEARPYLLSHFLLLSNSSFFYQVLEEDYDDITQPRPVLKAKRRTTTAGALTGAQERTCIPARLSSLASFFFFSLAVLLCLDTQTWSLRGKASSRSLLICTSAELFAILSLRSASQKSEHNIRLRITLKKFSLLYTVC